MIMTVLRLRNLLRVALAMVVSDEPVAMHVTL
jgi:hypothetical protein